LEATFSHVGFDHSRAGDGTHHLVPRARYSDACTTCCRESWTWLVHRMVSLLASVMARVLPYWTSC
jgi:hypothetical protein